MKLETSRTLLSASVISIVLSITLNAQAQSVDGDTISWPAEDWYQVQHVPTQNWNVCNSTDDGTSCVVPPGTYVVINHQTGERFDNIIVLDSDLGKSFRQTEEIHPFGSLDDARGGAVMTRSETEVSARLSMMDLDENSAYSVWWVVFNEPANCVTSHSCGESDVFSAPDVLNADQIPAAKISVFYADGFVTGSDGIANVYAHLQSGVLPAGTFVNFGWSEPVAGGPDANSGLIAGNGLGAEIHLVIRTHGPAVAGSVGVQTTTFSGLCDVQTCTDQFDVIFPSPSAP